MAGHFHRVPPRSWAELERHTIAFIEYFAPECLKVPQPFPIEDVIQYRLNEIEDPHEVEFGIGSEYELGSDGTEGCVDWDVERQIYQVLLSRDTFEGMLSGDGRARQSAAHELAHYLEHRDVIRELRESERGLSQVPINAFFRRFSELKPYENAERQADVFASRLLQPASTGRILISQTSFNQVHAFSETFQVSRENARTRLKELGHPS